MFFLDVQFKVLYFRQTLITHGTSKSVKIYFQKILEINKKIMWNFNFYAKYSNLILSIFRAKNGLKFAYFKAKIRLKIFPSNIFSEKQKYF